VPAPIKFFIIREEKGEEERRKIEKKSKDVSLRSPRTKRDREEILIKVLC